MIELMQKFKILVGVGPRDGMIPIWEPWDTRKNPTAKSTVRSIHLRRLKWKILTLNVYMYY